MARVIAGYEIGETLGSGIEGKVKLGRDVETGETVAIKLVPLAHARKNERSWASMQKEIACMKAAVHPHVIGLKHVDWECKYPKKNGTKKDVIMIVMELAQGGELFDFMMYTGAFPETIARAYFRQLVEGVAYCHSVGVYHRDLKPENLLLDGQFRLKIADFGLSAISHEADGSMSLLKTECGTRGYMSPEIIARQMYAGEPADVWAMGVILFISICGFPPFQVAGAGDWWFQRIKRGRYDQFWKAHLRQPSARAGFTQGSINLLNQIFVADPAKRITVAAMMADPWVCEEVPSLETLHAELARRKQQVEREKRAEKLAERRRKEAEKRAAAGNAFDPMAVDVVYRSIAVDGVAAAEEPGPPAPALPASHIQKYTMFYSDEDATEILHYLSQTFSQMCSDHSMDEGAFKIKAAIATPVGAIDVKAQVYACPTARRSSLHAVEVTRRRGNMLKFQEVYKVLCSNLADIISAPPETEEEAAAAGASEAEEKAAAEDTAIAAADLDIGVL